MQAGNATTMLQGSHWNRRHLFVIALFGCCLFFRLGAPPIYILDEARNAQCAWEMQQKPDYIVPLFNGELRSDKPPLHYYFIMGAYTLLGKTAFAARFFSALCGFITLLLTYFFTKKFYNDKLAFYTVCVLGLSVHFLFEFRLAVPDPYLILFQTLTLFCFYGFSRRQNWQWLYAAALFAALATLAKGPAGVLLPAFIFIIYLLTLHRLTLLLNWHLLGCLLLYLAIAAPWFWLVHNATNGEFTRLFFVKQNIGRFSSTMEGHNNFPGLPLLIMVAGLLPVSVLFFSGRQLYRQIWRNDFTRFALVVCGVTILFYSFSATMLPHYPMVCYPFAAVLLAFLMLQIKTGKPYFLGLSFFYLLLGVAGAVAMKKEKALEANTWLWAIVLLLPLVLLLCYTFIPFLNRKYSFLIGGFMLFNCLILGFAYPAVYRQNPVSANLVLIKSRHVFGSFGKYNPAINFYISSPVKQLADSAAVASFLANDRNALLIGREKDLPLLDKLPVRILARHRDLFEKPTTVFLERSDSLYHFLSKE